MRHITCTVTFLPFNKTITVDKGINLLEAALQADLLFNHVCGGSGGCLRCRLELVKGRVTGGNLPVEESKLYPEKTILACQAVVTEDVTVMVPAGTSVELRSHSTVIEAHEAVASSVYTKLQPDALIRRYALSLEKPSLADNLADEQRLQTALARQLSANGDSLLSERSRGVSAKQPAHQLPNFPLELPLELVKELPALLRFNNYQITVTLGELAQSNRVLAIEGGDTSGLPLYMVIVDIGTTTVVAHLVDTTTKRTLATAACYNSQGMYGRDVTARMIASEKKGVKILQTLIVDDINRLLASMLKEAQLAPTEIKALVCAGNTVMCHLLLALPVESIRRTPFVAVTVEPPVLTAQSIGFSIHPQGLLYVLPGISAWVGSDITAGVLYTGMQETNKLTFLVDIGTNGEIVIGHKEWLMSAAASAGPALEGAHMACGMRAEPGAIEQVFAEHGVIKYKTIGDLPPKGLCGSGIIDLLSVLLEEGLINRSGKFTQPDHPQITHTNGKAEYILVEPNASATGQALAISESDIENIITAKAAIFSAIYILMQRLSLRFEDLEQFYLAGAFGSHLNLKSCQKIGLIPPLPLDKIRFVGNSSLEGAKLAAFHRSAYRQLFKIRSETIYYDLMGADDYVAEFRKALFLPHTDIELFRKRELN